MQSSKTEAPSSPICSCHVYRRYRNSALCPHPCLPVSFVNLQVWLHGGFNSKLIASLIFWNVAVSAHPIEFNLMFLQQRQQAFPKVHVFNWLLVGLSPAPFYPAFQPTLIYGIHHILGVAVQRHLARMFQRLQRNDNSTQLHAIVCSCTKPFGKL